MISEVEKFANSLHVHPKSLKEKIHHAQSLKNIQIIAKELELYKESSSKIEYETLKTLLNERKTQIKQHLEHRKKYIALGKETEKNLRALIAFAPIKNNLNQAIHQILQDPEKSLETSFAQFSTSLSKMLEKFRQSYKNFYAQEENVIAFLGEINFAHQFDDADLFKTRNYADRLGIATQITNPLIRRLLLDGTLSTVMLDGENISDKINWINIFMEGETPKNLSSLLQTSAQGQETTLKDLFNLTDKEKDQRLLKQLMQERERQILIKDIRNNTLREVLQNNPNIFIKDHDTITATNVLYEREKIPTKFRIMFKQLTAHDNQPGHVLTTFDLTQLFKNPSQFKEAYKSQIVEIARDLNTIRIFFVEQRKTLKDVSTENMSVQIKHFLELNEAIHENKEFFPLEELKKIKTNLRETERAIVKFSKNYLDYLSSEYKKIERDIQHLTKMLAQSHLDATAISEAKTALPTKLDKLDQHLRDLKNSFPVIEKEQRNLSPLLQKIYRETEKSEARLSQLEEKFKKTFDKIKERFHEQTQPTIEAASFFKPQQTSQPTQTTIENYKKLRTEYDSIATYLDAFATQSSIATDAEINQLTTKQFHLNQQIQTIEKQFPNIQVHHPIPGPSKEIPPPRPGFSTNGNS